MAELQADKVRIGQQLVAIQGALAALDKRGVRRGKTVKRRPKPVRKAMSAAARKAVSRRMKAYWAKRKSEGGGLKG